MKSKTTDLNLDLPELSLRQFFILMAQFQKIFFVLFLISFLIVSYLYAVKVPYVSESRLQINESKFTMIESEQIDDSLRRKTLIRKNRDYFKTQDFYEALLKDIRDRSAANDYRKIDPSEFEFFVQVFDKKYSLFSIETEPRIMLTGLLSQWLEFQLISDYELKIIARTPEARFSNTLSNIVADFIFEYLKSKESLDAMRLEMVMMDQKKQAEDRLTEAQAEILKMSLGESSAWLTESKEVVESYLSGLKEKSEKIRYQMMEGQKQIKHLRASLYSEKIPKNKITLWQKIKLYQSQNELNQNSLDENEKKQLALQNQLSGWPQKSQRIERLKEIMQLEQNEINNINLKIHQLDMQKLSQSFRFEITERSNLETTVPGLSFWILISMGFGLSQLLGVVIIFFMLLLNPGVLDQQISEFKNQQELEGENQEVNSVENKSLALTKVMNTRKSLFLS